MPGPRGDGPRLGLMDRSRDPRVAWLAIAAVVVVAGGVATIGVHAHLSPDGRAAVDGLLVAACLAGAAVGLTRYGISGDTHPLFVAAGLLAIAGQTVLFDQNWILSNSTMPWEAISLPSLGWLVGWLIAAAGFLLARPWWDRRGRAPIRARLVLPATAIALAIPDAALVLLRHSLPHAKNIDLRRGGAFALTSPLHWFFGVAVVGLLLVASWRELRAGGDVRSPHPWMAMAWVIAAAGQLVLVARPISYRPLIVPADVLPPIGVALALIAFLAPQRAEASRARRATDRAQEVMGGRAEIAAMIAHEVRGPVATIRGLAGTALAYYDRLGEAERREFFDLIEQESRRLLATVTQASTALKVDAATLHYEMRAQDLGRVIRVGVEAAEIGEHPITVDVPEGLEATVDHRWFAEVVRQLVDNAARFSPPQGSIRVSADADERMVTIEVADEGPGIPQERREEVFGKYVSWRPEGFEQAGGSGLGLFLVRGIVTAHAGEVRIGETALGGTMLRISIPREGEWQTDRSASPS